jgi:hypothetical protein
MHESRRRNAARIGFFGAVAVGYVLGSLYPVAGALAQTKTSLEDIYVLRSVRESRVPATEFCSKARTGFDGKFEDHFVYRTVNVSASDGRIVDAAVQIVGRGHACFGPTADPAVSNFYTEMDVGTISWKGLGDCRLTKSDAPEHGMLIWRCFLDLSDLPGSYAGGVLITNSLSSRAPNGLVSDPPGYTQTAIITIRLWKKPDGG